MERTIVYLEAELKQCCKLLENGQRPETHKEWARRRIAEISAELGRDVPAE